jgi:hypothetical protein
MRHCRGFGGFSVTGEERSNEDVTAVHLVELGIVAPHFGKYVGECIALRLAAVERERDEALRAVEYFDAQSRRRKSRLAAALARIEAAQAALGWRMHPDAPPLLPIWAQRVVAALAAPAATPEPTEETR